MAVMKLKKRKKERMILRPRVLDDVIPSVVAHAEEQEDEEPKEKLSFGEQSLDEVLSKAIDISDRCSDVVVYDPRQNLSVDNDGSLFKMEYNGADGVHHEGALTKYALTQFGSKIGVPAPYLQKCVNKKRPDLAKYNITEWLKEYEKPLFIREYRDGGGSNYVRGVLSEKYSVCDTPDIIDGIDKVLDLGNFTIRGNFVSPERFHIRLADREQMDVSGEDLFSGLSIDSSDVGRSTLRVNFLVYKQVCSNGLIISRSSSQLFRQKHIGITADDFRASLEKGFESYPVIAKRVRSQIERTRNSDSPLNFNYESDEELEALIEQIRNNTKVLTPKGAEKVVEIMRSNRYENNRWGYVNSLTEVAQDLTLEKRLQLESYAGKLLVA